MYEFIAFDKYSNKIFHKSYECISFFRVATYTSSSIAIYFFFWLIKKNKIALVFSISFFFNSFKQVGIFVYFTR